MSHRETSENSMKSSLENNTGVVSSPIPANRQWKIDSKEVTLLRVL